MYCSTLCANYVFYPRALNVSFKGKAIPLHAWICPEGSRRLRLPDVSTQSAHDGCKVVGPMHRPPLPPKKYSWYSFLLEAESSPGP